ncbi:MAG: 50S ribosomal protein L23 [Spirochaetia bacterium]|nr:50S ribosomal protein L23 [Spirochaetia bacterium]
MDLNDVIQSPVITEKTETIKNPRKDVNRYSFRVHPEANKESIRQALHHLFQVKAVKINVLVNPGKKKRFRYSKIKLPSWKKAIVTLASGQSIDFTKTA